MRHPARKIWAETIRQADGDPRPPIQQAEVERDPAAVRTQLDETAFNIAWVEGQTMIMEQVMGFC